MKAFSSESERESDTLQDESENARKVKEKVQILGPHLLHQLKHYPEIEQIFTLTQPNILPGSKKKALCKVQVNHLKSALTIQLEGTEVSVRPCLFIEKGYPKLNNILLERVPVHHPSILSIGTALTKVS